MFTVSADDLAHLSEISFANAPTASTPLLVNVTGGVFSGGMPNLAGISGAQAPYLLWNFPSATQIVVDGGASLEGTLYAPNAALLWQETQNIEGNVIAKSFVHGQPLRDGIAPQEIHDFPFATTLMCQPAPTTTTTAPTTTTTAPTTTAPTTTIPTTTAPTTTAPTTTAPTTSTTTTGPAPSPSTTPPAPTSTVPSTPGTGGSGSGGELPNTGSTVGALLLTAAGLLIVGIGLVMGGRRRTSR